MGAWIAAGVCAALALAVVVWALVYKPMLRAWGAFYGIDMLKGTVGLSEREEVWLRSKDYD